MFKAILLDLDDTIYDYKPVHSLALGSVLAELNKEYPEKELHELHKLYESCQRMHQSMTKCTAVSHNKLLTFKKMLEILSIKDSITSEKINPLKMLENYWNVFYSHMKVNSYVTEFLKSCKTYGMKICVLTDFMYENQVEKLERLGLTDLIDLTITSEEVGADKPDPKIFLYALNVLSLRPDEVCMIGDSYEKDIQGALNLGIYAYQLSNTLEMQKTPIIYEKTGYSTFHSFYDLNEHFTSIFESITELIRLSNWFGQRFDLVQAGGGNISVKTLDNKFTIIKSSGVTLSEVTKHNGYSILSNATLNTTSTVFSNTSINVTDVSINVIEATKALKDAKWFSIINKKTKPSIETALHMVLKKYTVHLHPIHVNKFTTMKDGDKILSSIFPNSLIIPYIKPGLDLANYLEKNFINCHEIIFLMSHGLIITANEIERIFELNNEINDTLAKFDPLGSSKLEKYKFTNDISEIHNTIKGKNHVTYCSEVCHTMYRNFVPSTPDTVVYCGKPLIISELSDIYSKNQCESSENPSIVIYKDNVYITSHSLKKCKEIEEVLLSTLLTTVLTLETTHDAGSINQLSKQEIDELVNWDAEKFRMNI